MNDIHQILTKYAQNHIKVAIEAKKVKNINFRLKPIDEPPFTTLMSVSYPTRLPTHALLKSLQERLSWAIDCQKQQQNRKQNPKISAYFSDVNDLTNLNPESTVFYQGQAILLKDLFQQFSIKESDFLRLDFGKTLLNIYKYWLINFIQNRQSYWQAKVGKSATKITPYIMKTRWGSCSTQAKTIRLSVWLAQFEPSCADYVLVHELCHLHEANHSARFWRHVEQVMPDYQVWHNKLKFKD